MRGFSLDATERDELREQLHGTHDARIYQRTLAILELGQGRPVAEVATLLRVSPRTVERWEQAYASARTPEALHDQPGRGRPRLWDRRDQAFLRNLLRRSPQDLGYPATQWTVPLLTAHLAGLDLPPCSGETLRRMLHELDQVWKRPRYGLEEDPQVEKKKTHPGPAQATSAPQRGAF